MPQVSGLYSDLCCVQAASTVELTRNRAAVASTSTSGSATTVRHRVGQRVRRTCTNQSTVSSQNSLKQSFERRRRLYCSLCRVKLNADQQAEQHYRGKLHSRKSKKLTLLNTTSDTADTQVKRRLCIHGYRGNYAHSYNSRSLLSVLVILPTYFLYTSHLRARRHGL